MRTLTPTNLRELAQGTRHEQEAALLFCVLQRGRNSKRCAELVNRLFGDSPLGPFQIVDSMTYSELCHELRPLGIQTQLAKTWIETVGLYRYSPLEFTIEELRQINGVGMKIASFIMNVFGCDTHAVLDVHILNWLGSRGYKVPKETPKTERSYMRYSKLALEEMRRTFPGLTPHEADTHIWKEMNAGRTP